MRWKDRRERLIGDEDFYYCHNENCLLEGMISSHVDDFVLAGTDEFFKEITEVEEKNLDISKLEEKEYRFSGIDVNSENGVI